VLILMERRAIFEAFKLLNDEKLSEIAQRQLVIESGKGLWKDPAALESEAARVDALLIERQQLQERQRVSLAHLMEAAITGAATYAAALARANVEVRRELDQVTDFDIEAYAAHVETTTRTMLQKWQQFFARYVPRGTDQN
jgi:hypothetical protein